MLSRRSRRFITTQRFAFADAQHLVENVEHRAQASRVVLIYCTDIILLAPTEFVFGDKLKRQLASEGFSPR